MEKYWFVRKNYGYGWKPATWQGWTILLLYVIAIVCAGINGRITNKIDPSSFIPEVFFYTLILLLLCFHTGETPRWQWKTTKKNHLL